ncbi:ralBP1-associated Eps domain-containing protein 1 isoform X1 [Drosophila miranda]|nr:ralBP1-associated Eps domain-containing protein 1 isoform X1 [Drosophila miranda]XP_017151413.1 ralBP1-associated Eps domain-containing protein 1 isoform X1 [Drosophila miranda]XP_033248588.1 ralBP1-associated Eps domain-containing protein 1 isoform X1 [Drosophila miranda]
MDVTLTEPETRFYSELFHCCDVEKTGMVPMLKATELFRSSDIASAKLIEITGLAGIPSTALHISRAQFYSCLKLIAAHQAAMPLRQELIFATCPLPLPHFSWKELSAASVATENGLGALPPPPPTDRRNSLRRNSQQDQLQDTSDVPSTDSEVEQNESIEEAAGQRTDGSGVVSSSSRENVGRRRGGSPEAWSTNSDSPTPTNSVAERPWAQDPLWQGLLGDEHRQLLGTEEESSDRHSSDDDDNENELVAVYQITAEQREYYNKQFKTVQRDPHGLLSGQAARVFFEKSRIPVEELRHIWQLCDVTRDGALSLSEFTAAMHLVVLRRNNIPLPTSLPHCLHPNVLQTKAVGGSGGVTSSSSSSLPQEPPEADLLHLNDDDEDEQTDNTIIGVNLSGGSSAGTSKPRPTVPPNDKNIMNLSTISTSSQASNSSRREATPTTTSLNKNRSISNSPNHERVVGGTVSSTGNAPDSSNASNQWTKFSESPTTSAAPAQSTTGVAASTSATAAGAVAGTAVAGAAAAAVPAVSSPGLKPVLFDMKRTAQDVVSNPQILHPVPLRVTPIGTAIASSSGEQSSDMDGVVVLREESPKTITSTTTVNNQSTAGAAVATAATATAATGATATHRESSDLRAIQRPQAKKLPAKNSVLPPPPQREPSIGSTGPSETSDPLPTAVFATTVAVSKKEPPPLPPPRPHRHARSSSLDLNKFKMGTTGGAQQAEITAQASFDMQTSAGFADFTHFADEGGAANVLESGTVAEQQLHSLPPAQPPPGGVPPTRLTLQQTQTQQRVSAFEVYRKPQTPRNSQSPPQQPPPPAPALVGSGAVSQLPSAETFEKRVTAISDSLRHVSFKQNQTSTTELLQRLREQNSSLLHLCNDLSDELLSVQTRKEEMRLRLESLNGGSEGPTGRTSSSISSAPVTANVTGGSSGSAGYTNV